MPKPSRSDCISTVRAGDEIGFNVPAVAKNQFANVIGGNTRLRDRLGEIFAELPLKWRPMHTGDLAIYRRHCSADQAATDRCSAARLP